MVLVTWAGTDKDGRHMQHSACVYRLCWCLSLGLARTKTVDTCRVLAVVSLGSQVPLLTQCTRPWVLMPIQFRFRRSGRDTSSESAFLRVCFLRIVRATVSSDAVHHRDIQC